MTATKSGGAQAGPSARDRTVGASPLTIRIYQAVLYADHPLTAREIHRWILERVGTAYKTDVSLWAQRRKIGSSRQATRSFELDRDGTARVLERISDLTRSGVLISDGLTGRGIEAHYTAGRAPKGYRSHKALRPWGWYDIDVERQTKERDRLIARPQFLERARAALQKKSIANARELISEAIRLLE